MKMSNAGDDRARGDGLPKKGSVDRKMPWLGQIVPIVGVVILGIFGVWIASQPANKDAVQHLLDRLKLCAKPAGSIGSILSNPIFQFTIGVEFLVIVLLVIFVFLLKKPELTIWQFWVWRFLMSFFAGCAGWGLTGKVRFDQEGGESATSNSFRPQHF
jgi:hypothetical protein